MIDRSGILKEWLANMTIAAFEYAAMFRIRLESNVRIRTTPNVLYLELRSRAFFGSYTEWTSLVESMPYPARRGELDYPTFAYRIMLCIGSDIIKVEILDDGTLVLLTSDNEEITISGIEDVWEESWILTESSDLPNASKKQIICDSQGEISFFLE
ncbi:hypothetical protein [Leptospira dzoumogneensis]|uniref:Uncharacterized protein n=1 Tax=Leptospira dzoumogneensis TaxID=2484904 RepID=A0A4Z1AB47_9LEPT|nr:hypothetical protein [Leptospira dzoumogneensis]TGM98457.1 hypothetical protein EHR06_10995 [Leptospira dzoumogneensis]